MAPSTRTTLCCVAVAALTNCSGQPNEQVEQADQNASALIETVKALEVKSAGPARMLQGEFEIRAPHPGEEGIDSSGLGGACLIAQIPNNPVKACTSNDECHIPPGTPAPGTSPNYWGYCMSGQCWIKGVGPGDPYCNKGVKAGKHSVPTTPLNTGAMYTYAASRADTRIPLRWSVLACLNGVWDPTKGKPPCGDGPGEVIHDQGNPRSVP